MSENKISNAIKKIRKEKKYSVAAISEKANITAQGFYKWLSKSDNEWNLDSLLILSKILDFKVCINKGEIEIMDNKNVLNKELIEVVNYEIYKDFGDYSIVNLYTPNGNLSIDDNPSILDECFLYSSKDEFNRELFTESIIKVYGLLNNKTNELEDENMTVSIYPNSAENYYYWHFAPIKGYTDDGYMVVEEFKEGYKLVKVGGLIDINYSEINDYTFKGYTNDLNDSKCIPGFSLLPINKNTSDDFISFSENVNFLYTQVEKLYTRASKKRFFDRNRSEIFYGDILVKKGLPEYLQHSQEMSDDFLIITTEINNYFKKYESVRVEDGFIFNIHGTLYFLDKLNLMEWEVVGNIED
ncbi:MAG: hypothetical protein IJH34_16240 [Romboutsia sp.]|nr:hypothetical protein [Romboutsia sp.]